MPRPANYSTSLLARVRRYYGLLQAELTSLLGISPELVKHIEAGRRALTREVSERLAPLLAPLPPTDAPASPEAAPPLTLPPEVLAEWHLRAPALGAEAAALANLLASKLALPYSAR